MYMVGRTIYPPKVINNLETYIMSISISFCGGAGALISRYLPDNMPEWTNNPTIRYLDTSESERSFIRSNCPFFLFKDPDVKCGSGGLRASKALLVKDQLPSFVVEHPHADINIVVVSSSGASGAVIAHQLIESMLAEKKKVIVLVSQSPTTIVRAANSYKTLMGFRSLASKFQNSIVGYVYDAAGGFDDADRYLVQDLTVLLYFLSGKISGVDESDTEVLLSPEKLPDVNYKPDLYSLNILFEDKYDLETTPMSIMTLSPVGGIDDIGSGAPVSFSGIVDQAVYDKMFSNDGGQPVVSLAIFNSHVPTWMTQLSKKIDLYKQRLDTQRIVKTEVPKGIDLSQHDGDLLL